MIMNMKLISNTATIAFLASTSRQTAAWGVSDYVVPCQDNDSDFDVSLRTSSGDLLSSKCIYSYARCPFNDDVGPDGKCLGNANDWTSEGGRSFDNLETRVFDMSSKRPLAVVVSDNKHRYECARALYGDNFRDFRFDEELKVKDWWKKRENKSDPVQITIVPHDCDDPGRYDVERSLSIWLSGYRGQDYDPNKGGIYCDLSINPEDCLNIPYWGVEGNELVHYGSLTGVLSQSPSEVNIYIPDGYDVNMPVNNLQLRFGIVHGYKQSCKKWANGNQGSACMVDKVRRASDPAYSKIVVSGLGRISGWDAMTFQRDNGYYCNNAGDPYNFDNLNQGTDVRDDWAGFAEWFVSSYPLELSAMPQIAGFSIDVSGVTVGWGSKHGDCSIRLNAVEESTYDYPVKTFDVKYVGGWNDQSDAIETHATGSSIGFAYLQCNDDSVKVSSTNTQQYQYTVLQGRAGCAVNIGAYGNYGLSNIDNSVTSGVYIHRILHASSDDWNGCGSGSQPDGYGKGGLICTRSCGQNTHGLVDYTLETLYVPELGTDNNGANSISRLFAIGVNAGGGYCGDGFGAVLDSYPIENIVLKDVNVYPTPGCMSLMYDDSGKVRWGGGGSHSVTFFDEQASNPDACDFQGAVSFSQNPSYFVCGYPDPQDAVNYCMSDQGVGSAPNVDYDIVNGANTNINYPVCGQSTAVA